MLKKPEENEYPEWYRNYISYINETEDIFEVLENTRNNIIDLYSGITEEKALYKYAEDKWSLKELLGHMIDAERILSLRGFRIARNDKTDIPQYDHEGYMVEADFDNQTVTDLLTQYSAVRESTLTMFKSLNEKCWEYTGTASGKSFTARSIPYIIAGHELHHLKVIKEKYL